MKEKIFEKREFLTAAHCNAVGELPLASLFDRFIEAASAHSNGAGFGYATLMEHNCTWVLSRVTASIRRMPRINESFAVATWVESVRGALTSRCYRLTDAAGAEIAAARTYWCAMDIDSRHAVDLAKVVPALADYAASGEPCDVPTAPKPRFVANPQGEPAAYRFVYSDIDFNRHVNTCRYIELLVDRRDMAYYDARRVSAIDVVFHHEALEGQQVQIVADTADPDAATVTAEIRAADGTHCCVARITTEPRGC